MLDAGACGFVEADEAGGVDVGSVEEASAAGGAGATESKGDAAAGDGAEAPVPPPPPSLFQRLSSAAGSSGYSASASAPAGTGGRLRVVQIRHLPPLTVVARLPPGYPGEAPPPVEL
jgi:hypothetical protein